MNNFQPTFKTRILEEVHVTSLQYVPQYLWPDHTEGDTTVPEAWVPFHSVIEVPGGNNLVGPIFKFKTKEKAQTFITMRTYEAKVVWESE